MNIFLSWSGDRSRRVAEALKEWLPIVFDNVRPWLSNADIQAGERWAIEVSRQLEEINFGIICLTRENLESPWILFEAGALSKSLEEGRVCPYLLDVDIRDLAGPLSQFQAKRTEKASTLELLKTINSSSSKPIEEARLTQRFEGLWSDLQHPLDEIPASQAEGEVPRRTTEEILEDLVKTVRATDRRISDLDSRFGYFEILMEEGKQEASSKTSSAWSLVMQRLKKKRVALTAAVYGEAEVMLEEDLMVLLFPGQESFHAKMAREPKHLTQLLDAIEEVHGFRPKEIKILPQVEDS